MIDPSNFSALWSAICDHPDYAGGSVWNREDVAGAIYHNEEDDPFDHASEEEIASISDKQMQEARNVTDNWLGASGGYSWYDAIFDLVSK